jgi:hypothetical protein
MKITELKIGKIYTYGGATSLAVYATPEMFNTKKVGRVNPSENIVVLATIREFAYCWIQVLTINGIVGWFVWNTDGRAPQDVDRYFIEEITSQYA